MTLPTLYENDDLWVYDKPSGVSLLKDRSGMEDLWHQLKQGPKPYLVHRLDKGTSGVLVVAKNQTAQSRFTRAFSERRVTKFYVALVDGFVPSNTSLVDLPLCKGRKSRYRIAAERANIKREQDRYTVVQDRVGVDAKTLVRPIARFAERTLVLIKPLTGRTHQIRVHLSWLGWPIVGDHLYNRDQTDERLGLHAHLLKLPYLPPFTSPLPREFYD
ncbi:MAG: hypothetical protein GKR90_23380 [Pseudomonadales bacterium]|nr:hypothetical protein [Pseudomonadales bacterium]